MPGEPGPQLLGAGHDQRPGLVDRLGPLLAGAALGHHQRPDRLHRPVAAPRRPRRSPGLGGPGRADRIQRIGLALPVPVLPVRAIHLHHPHPGRDQIAGQPGPVAAGALDAGQSEVPETAQPAEQFRVPGCCGGELLHAQQPADRIECSSDMQVSVRVHTASDDARVFYHGGHSRPFHG